MQIICNSDFLIKCSFDIIKPKIMQHSSLSINVDFNAAEIHLLTLQIEFLLLFSNLTQL